MFGTCIVLALDFRLVSKYLHAPRDTTEDFANDKCLDIWSEEQYEDKARHCDQGTDHRLAVAVPFADKAIDEQTDDLSGTRTIRPDYR